MYGQSRCSSRLRLLRYNSRRRRCGGVETSPSDVMKATASICWCALNYSIFNGETLLRRTLSISPENAQLTTASDTPIDIFDCFRWTSSKTPTHLPTSADAWIRRTAGDWQKSQKKKRKKGERQKLNNKQGSISIKYNVGQQPTWIDDDFSWRLISFCHVTDLQPPGVVSLRKPDTQPIRRVWSRTSGLPLYPTGQ